MTRIFEWILALLLRKTENFSVFIENELQKNVISTSIQSTKFYEDKSSCSSDLPQRGHMVHHAVGNSVYELSADSNRDIVCL